MPWLVVCGAVSIAAGIVLVLVSARRKAEPRRPMWEDRSPAVMHALHPHLDRLATVDGSLDRLDHAITTLMPAVGREVPEQWMPDREDVVALCALVRQRLVDMARHDLAGASPSRSASRFAELTAVAVPPVADPYSASLPAACFPHSPVPAGLSDALRPRPADVPADPRSATDQEPDRTGAEIVDMAVERYRRERQERDGAACRELVDRLVASGPVLCAEYGLLQRPPDADVQAIAGALQESAIAYLNALRPLWAGANRNIDLPAVARRDQARLSQQLTSAAATLATSAALLRERAHGGALRALGTMSLPTAPGWPPSDVFAEACRSATRDLDALCGARVAGHARLVEECAALVQRHVELVAGDREVAALDRLTQHDVGFRLLMAVARSVDRATAVLDGAEAGAAPASFPSPRRPLPITAPAVVEPG